LKAQSVQKRSLPDNGTLIITLEPGGSISINLQNAEREILDHFVSSWITLYSESNLSPPFLRMSLKWDKGKINTFIVNDVAVQNHKNVRSATVPSPIFPLQGTYSFDVTSIDVLCKGSVDARRSYFQILTSAAQQRSPKDKPTLILEFTEALNRLNRLLNFVRNGETIWLGTICTELRSLLILDDVGQNSRPPINHPLLLRVADIFDSPLPVYVTRESLPLNTAPGSFGFGTPPRIQADCDICIVQDLQEWLNRDFCYLDGQSPFSAKKFLKECAATLGPAHYDMNISDFVTHLSMSQTESTHSITGVILDIGACTLNLGSWLLSSNGFPFRIIQAT